MKVTRRVERQVLKRAGEAFGKDWLKPIASALAPAADVPTLEEHSIAPWILLRCVGGMEKSGTEWLERNGFEAWYPKGKIIKTVPLRHLPSKTRHKRANQQVVERERSAYPGYILTRWMFGEFDLNRVYELPGIIGVCCFGDQVATVPDYEVEIVRVQEARGEFDQFANTQAERIYFYHLAKDATAAENRYTGSARTLGRACESSALVTFRKTLDRVTRVISAPAATEAAR